MIGVCETSGWRGTCLVCVKSDAVGMHGGRVDVVVGDYALVEALSCGKCRPPLSSLCMVNLVEGVSLVDCGAGITSSVQKDGTRVGGRIRNQHFSVFVEKHRAEKQI
jgi:hypothetical protein